MIPNAPPLRQLRDCAKGAAVRHVERAKALGFRHMLLSFEAPGGHADMHGETPVICIAHAIAPEVHRQWASTRFQQDPLRRMKASGAFPGNGKPLLWENHRGRIVLPTGTPSMTAVEVDTMRWVYDYGMRTGVNIRPVEIGGREVCISFYSDRPRDQIASLDDTMAILFYLSHMIADDLKDDLKREVAPSAVKLTRRETECLRWVAAGKNAQETALILGLSVETIRDHLKRVRSKLGATTRAQALMRAYSMGLIDIPQ